MPVSASKDGVGEPLNLLDPCARGHPLAPGLDDVTAGEGGRIGGQSGSSGEIVRDGGQIRLLPCRDAEECGHLFGAEPETLRAGCPCATQVRAVPRGHPGLARLERGGLRPLRGVRAALGHLGEDLHTSSAERRDDIARNTGDFGRCRW